MPPDSVWLCSFPMTSSPGDVRQFVTVIQGPKTRGAKKAAAGDADPIAWLPRFHLTKWPEDFPMRREDLYGDDGR